MDSRRFLYRGMLMGLFVLAAGLLYDAADAEESIVPVTRPDLALSYQKQLAALQQPTLQELNYYIDQARLLTDELQKRVQMFQALRSASYIVLLRADAGLSTMVAGSKAVPLAEVVLDAARAGADSVISSLVLLLEAPEDNSQKGLSNCQLWDGTTSLGAGVNPSPSKSDSTAVAFPFTNALVIPKGASKTLTLTCDGTKDPQGPATYAWRFGLTAGRKALLTSSGSFVLEVASSSPTARGVRGGSMGEIATVLDFYAADEAVRLQMLALQIDGNPRAVTAYSLWDGETQVGGGMLSGDSVFKVALSAPFEIPKDGHKLLTIKVDTALVTTGGHVQEGDGFAINFDGSTNNFHLTHGIGAISGRGIIPSTQVDTDAPSITLSGS